MARLFLVSVVFSIKRTGLVSKDARMVKGRRCPVCSGKMMLFYILYEFRETWICLGCGYELCDDEMPGMWEGDSQGYE